MTRSQWGGALYEEATLNADTKLISMAPLMVEAVAAPAAGAVSEMAVEVDEALTRSAIKDRVVLSEGITLATAPVVVSGGRAVGSEEAFAPLEELAETLGGKVGCSRAVNQQRLAPPQRPSRPDRHPHRPDHLHRQRHQRSHPALGRRYGIEEHPCDQHVRAFVRSKRQDQRVPSLPSSSGIDRAYGRQRNPRHIVDNLYRLRLLLPQMRRHRASRFIDTLTQPA